MLAISGFWETHTPYACAIEGIEEHGVWNDASFAVGVKSIFRWTSTVVKFVSLNPSASIGMVMNTINFAILCGEHETKVGATTP